MPRDLPPRLRFRSTRPEDAIPLYRVQRRAIHHGCSYNRAQVAAWLTAISPAYLARTLVHRRGVVCDDGDRAVGFGQLDVDRARVTALYVEPAFMGRGVGDALLRRLAHLAHECGLSELILQSSPNAVSFYERRRFVGVASHHIGIPGAPALEVFVMARSL